jgi:hypothetical protein
VVKGIEFRNVGGKGTVIATPLYVDDDLLSHIVLGAHADHWREVRRAFERQGMPSARSTVRGLYYLPAQLRFFDRREGLARYEEYSGMFG